MKAGQFCSAIVLALALASGPALACTSPTEYPYDPTRYPSDVVIEGVAASTGQSSGEPYADIKVADVFVGEYSPDIFRLQWWVGGGGMCDPPGPDIRVGQEVRIYLTKEGRELRPLGWVLTNEVSKSLRQIQVDQAIAKEKVARQEKYFPVGGALSFNDPKEWLTVDDIPELRRSKFPVIVSFSVGPDGTMNQCESGHVERYEKLDLKACAIIQKRARLVPPKFPQESSGYFEFDASKRNIESGGTQTSLVQTGTRSVIAALIALVGVVAAGFLFWFARRNRSK